MAVAYIAAEHPEIADLGQVFVGYPVRLPVFEGPLDLLLYLIQKQELEIEDIPVATITSQYLAYLAALQVRDIEVAGEFLVMAATLVEIKSRMLLPREEQPPADDEEGVDPRAELVARLLEYQRYKQAAEELRGRAELRTWMLPRGLLVEADGNGNGNGQGYLMLNQVSGFDLWAAFQEVWSRAREPEAGEIARPRITIAMKIAEISNRLLWSPEGISFFSLFSSDVTKLEVIVTFLAILELIRLRRLKVRQPRPFAEIMVYPNGKH